MHHSEGVSRSSKLVHRVDVRRKTSRSFKRNRVIGPKIPISYRMDRHIMLLGRHETVILQPIEVALIGKDTNPSQPARAIAKFTQETFNEHKSWG